MALVRGKKMHYANRMPYHLINVLHVIHSRNKSTFFADNKLGDYRGKGHSPNIMIVDKQTN